MFRGRRSPRSGLRSRIACAGALIGLATIAAAPPARADLQGEAERLAKLWSARGAEVERLAPIFLEHGRTRLVGVDAPLRSVKGAGEGCLTVAVLGVRTTEFVIDGDPMKAPSLALAPEARVPLRPSDSLRSVRSASGAAVLVRCGAERDELGKVAIEMASPRGAIEMVVARSAQQLGALSEVLPERAAGPIAPRGSAGGPMEPGPLADRLARAERRARGDGAVKVSRVVTRASASGAGEFAVRLREGCHRAEVMAEVPSVVPRRATDLDGEARVRETGRVLAQDRGDVPDVRLDFCLGEPTQVTIPWNGASGAVNVTLALAEWPIPAHVPASFGARARAGFAGALRRRHAPEPQAAPIVESLGVQGSTRFPVEVEPGRCYLAAAALIRGDARLLRIGAVVGDRALRDDATVRPEGVALTFCADTETSVVLEVDARGSLPWWALALWPMGSAGR